MAARIAGRRVAAPVTRVGNDPEPDRVKALCDQLWLLACPRHVDAFAATPWNDMARGLYDRLEAGLRTAAVYGVAAAAPRGSYALLTAALLSVAPAIRSTLCDVRGLANAADVEMPAPVIAPVKKAVVAKPVPVTVKRLKDLDNITIKKLSDLAEPKKSGAMMSAIPLTYNSLSNPV